MENINSIRASNERGLEAFLARAELAKVRWCLGHLPSLSIFGLYVALSGECDMLKHAMTRLGPPTARLGLLIPRDELSPTRRAMLAVSNHLPSLASHSFFIACFVLDTI